MAKTHPWILRDRGQATASEVRSPRVEQGPTLRPGERERGPWTRRGGGLLGAGLLAMVAFGAPGLSLPVAAAHGPTAAQEWPTAPDRGPAPIYAVVRRPVLPAAPVVALAPHHEAHTHDWLVVQEPEPLTGRQRRLLRRAERHAKKAARLRAKSGVKGQAAYKVFHVPVAAPARPVHDAVVHHAGCDHEEPPKIVLPQIVLPQIVLPQIVLPKLAELDGLEAKIERALAGVEFERITADVERQVEHALRGAERARERAEREAQRAGREAQRQAERAQRQAARAQVRAGEAVRREVDRALRDGVIDAEERRRIGEAAREAARR